MVDSGVRIAAALLPAGIPVAVGIVLAALRRRVMPQVSLPALIGLALQLVILLISAFLVGFLGLLLESGWTQDEILTLSSVVGLALIPLQLVSWTLILVALFVRLPATAGDRTPTGRHALLDARGAQVVAEEGTTLLPVAVGAGAAGAGVAGAPALSEGDGPSWETPPLQQPAPPRPWGPPDEPADTETIAASPHAGPDPSSFPTPGTEEAQLAEDDLSPDERTGPDGQPAEPEEYPDDEPEVAEGVDDEDPDDEAVSYEPGDDEPALLDPEDVSYGTDDADDNADDDDDDDAATAVGDEDGSTTETPSTPQAESDEAGADNGTDDTDDSADDTDPTEDAGAGGTGRATPAPTGAPGAAPRTSDAHPWFSPTGTGNPVRPAAGDAAEDDTTADDGQATEARPGGASERT